MPFPKRSLLRAILLPVAGLALLAVLPGCGHRETLVQIGNREQILHMGNLSEPTDLDPQIISSQQDFNIVLSLMEGLTNYDPKSCDPVAADAVSWEHSEDGLAWTFHLRPEERWSNGDPVVASDYVFAYQRMLSPGLASEYAYLLFVLKGGEDFNAGRITDFSQVGVKAIAPLTLQLTLRKPVPYFLRLLSHSSWYPVHPATILKYGKIDERATLWTRPGNYVGNGPFVLADWKPNQVIRVTKSPTYWNRDAVKLKEINFYPIESEATEESTFRAGQLHVTSTIPISKIAVYKDDAKLAPLLHQEPQLATYFYRFNVKRKPLDDVRVRRALSMAIDRVQMVEQVTKGDQDPAYALVPPGTGGYTPPEGLIKTDFEEARRLLAEAGYPGGKGFPHLEILYNTNEGHRQIAEAIQQMWRINLGIDVGLHNEEAKVWNDTMRKMDYDIGRMAWVGDYLDPSTFLDVMLSDSGNNQTGWAKPEFDKLVTEADHDMDQAHRMELYAKAETILIDESPIAPIYIYKRNNLRRPEVKGWYGNLLDLHPYTGVYLDASAAEAGQGE